MKLTIDQKKKLVYFIPEEDIDYFNLGYIHAKHASSTLTSTDTDHKTPCLIEFSMTVSAIIRGLVRMKVEQ